MPRKRVPKKKLLSPEHSQHELIQMKEITSSSRLSVSNPMPMELEIKELKNLLFLSSNKMTEIQQSVSLSQHEILKHNEEIVKQSNINKELRDEILICCQTQVDTETSLKKLKGENDQLNEKLKGLFTKLQESSTLNMKYKSEITFLQNEKTNMERKNEKLQKDFNLFRIESANKYDIEIMILQEKIKKLESKYEDLQLEHQNVKMENEILRARNKGVIDSFSNLSAEYAIQKVMMQETNSQLNFSIDCHKNEITALQRKYDVEVLSFKKNIADKNVDIQKQATEIEGLKSHLKALLNKFTSHNDSLTSEILSLNQLKDILRKEKNDLENEACQWKEKLKLFDLGMTELNRSLTIMNDKCLQKAAASCLKRNYRMKLKSVLSMVESLQEAITDISTNFK